MRLNGHRLVDRTPQQHVLPKRRSGNLFPALPSPTAASLEMPMDAFGDWGCKEVSQPGLNGITIRYADTATTVEEEALPIILFVHGWPESWFSWRHQLKAVKAAGYRGIAPDCRGYGGTSAPADYTEYTVHHIANDMIELLKHVGATKAALVGHDHGANMGWWIALLHPEIFTCYMAMSVPYGRGRKGGALTAHRKAFGDEREPETDPNFFCQQK